jgi:hypothetical protein
MLTLTTSEVIDAYLRQIMNQSEFADWLYRSKELEEKLPAEIYLELINLDYSEKENRYDVKKLIDPFINYAELHKKQIIELLNNILNHHGSPSSILWDLYGLAMKGYWFLGDNHAVGNLNEMGKSILWLLDARLPNSSDKERWELIENVDKELFESAKEIISKLESTKIRLLGTKTIGNYNQESFNYLAE